MSTSDLSGESPDVPSATFSERMNVLVDRIGSPEELAKRSQLSRRVIDKYRSGESEPNRPRLVAMARSGGVSVEWLASGEGPMVYEPAVEVDAPSDGYVALPRYDVRAGAGTGAIVEQEQLVDWIYFKQEWLRRTLGISPQQLGIIEAVGDSMSPAISDGDLLLVDVGEPQLRGDGVYVIAVDDVLLVKRIAIQLSGGLVISSDNPQYQATRQEIMRDDLDRVRLVGRVVWVGGRL